MSYSKLLMSAFFILSASFSNATIVEVSCSAPRYLGFNIYLNGKGVDSFEFPIVMDSNKGDILKMSYCSSCCGIYCGYPIIETAFESTIGAEEINIHDYGLNQSYSFPINQKSHLYEAGNRKVSCAFREI